jgi:asparagine synthase (glutamine-hydrolysing)
MLSEDGNIALVFNGEIYNYIEIRESLITKGHEFKTSSDTEVILHSYLEYGEDCVQQFNGMWAIAIYDFAKQKLFCSRDRMGVKPFYYTTQNNELVFSSELKALHAVLDLKKANLQKIYEYLAYGYRVNDGESFFEDCYELQPGTNMILENGQLRFEKYWTLKENLYQHCDQLSYEEAYVKLFESAVKLRYRSDVPVALLLSGGLDSSAIAKVTDNLISSGELPQNEVHAYIASFPNYKYDETPIAREFIKTCKHIKLHEMEIDSKRTVDDFEKIVYGLDHPVFSFTSIAHNNIMSACHDRNIKVVLNGQGSDEAYAGYDRYMAGAYLLQQLISRKGKFLEEFRTINAKNKFSKPFLIAQMMKSVLDQSYTAYLRAKYQEKSIHCLSKDFIKEGYDHYQPGYKFSLKKNNFTNYLLNTIRQQGLNHILHYEDISAMQQSIEIRSPFMDYRMMEFAFSIPTELKFNNGVTKLIQRKTIGTMLPDSITKNRQKIGFQTPFKEFISEDKNFKGFVNDLLSSEKFKSKRIWNAQKIQKVFKDKDKYPNFPFWRVINLEVWSRVYGITNL